MKKIMFIGIAGVSGAGKTTVSQMLVTAYPERFECISFDDYLLSPETFELYNGYVNWDSPVNYNFDKLLNDVEQLHQGSTIQSEMFAKDKHGKHLTRTITPKPIVIIEGQTLFYNPRIRNIFSTKIFFDISVSTMLARREMQWGNNELKDYDLNVVLPQFLKYIVPQKRYADAVVDAKHNPDAVMAEILTIVDETAPIRSSIWNIPLSKKGV